jgi:hypothetical protein
MSAKQAKKERKEAKENESDRDRLERWNKDTKFQLTSPFGPKVALIQIPEEILKKLIKLSDQILEDPNRVDWGGNLVGQVAEEPWVSNKQLEEIGVLSYLHNLLYNYVWNSLAQSGMEPKELNVHLDHMWMVSQHENEYNPIHFHTYCDLSSVIWLKIPEMDDRSVNGRLPGYKQQRDGMIEFVYKTACPGGLERGSMSFLPEPGQFAIFPSNLLHTVYPFKGSGERRSLAFNSHWSAITKDGKVFDKSMRMPSDQNNEDYGKTLKSKGEVSQFAESKQRSPDSGASKEEDKS